MILRCIGGPLEGEVFELDPSQTYILGRKPTNDEGKTEILLDSRSVSRKHCELSFDGATWMVRDLDSFNGIRLNQLKVKEGYLEPGSVLQTGEFSFIFESEANESADLADTDAEAFDGAEAAYEDAGVEFEPPLENTESPHQKKKKREGRESILKKYIDKFHALDFKYKIGLLLVVVGLLSHQVIVKPMIAESRKSILIESLRLGRAMTKNLGERNKDYLRGGDYFLLDCRFLDGESGVVEGYLFDAQGNLVCPVASDLEAGALVQTSLERYRNATNCGRRVLEGNAKRCEFTYPILHEVDGLRSQELVGVARVVFEPDSAFKTVQALKGLSWKLLIFVLILMTGATYLIFRWLKEAVEEVSDSANLAYSGTIPAVEKLSSFSPLDPVVSEINKLIAKSNQGLKSDSETTEEEASFLQIILQQVLLLEERAMMVVDTENQIIATSQTVGEMIPVNWDQIQAGSSHISEAIEDSHLQGELLSFLNDLSLSSEVIDKPLSLADRVVHAQGMPIFYNESHVATLVYFPIQ